MQLKPFFASAVCIYLLACTNGSSVKSNHFDEIKTYGVKGGATLRPLMFDSSLSIPAFFKTMAIGHQSTMEHKWQIAWGKIRTEHKLLNDSVNSYHFQLIKMMHLLFTSKGAWNGAKGEVLNIPYFWHWVQPNPRHSIHSIQNNCLLNKVKTPKAFAKYNSYADIDRTPFLFLSEMMAEKPLYYTENEDSFSTFGWCSEREMAFVNILEILGYKGKVVAQGNHSWTLLYLEMKGLDNKSKNLLVKIDNTFDELTYSAFQNPDFKTWYNDVGTHRLEIWYNKMARSNTQKASVQTYFVSVKTMKRIDAKWMKYLKG